MYSLLTAKTRGLQTEALEFAQDLIRTPSPSQQEADVARQVAERMESLGYDRVLTDEFGNVVGVLYGRQGHPTLLLGSHMDTTDVGDEAMWRSPPHSGEVCDGKLIGLGASDCKAGLAAQVYAGCLLKRSLLPLRGNLIVAATVSEEQGGSPGLRHLLRDTLPSLDLQPDLAILGEPTALSIYYGHDGSAMFEVLVEGPDRFQVTDATNAVYATFRDQFQATGHADARERQSLGEPRFMQAPGTATGLIPVCRRLPDSDTVSGVLEQIKREARLAAESVARVAVNVNVKREERRLYTQRTTVLEQRIEAWSLDPYHSLVVRSRQALAAAGCPVACGKWQLPRLGMGTAGGVLVNEFHVPAIGYGPGAEETCHVPNESVSVTRFNQAIYGTAAIAHALVGVPVCGWTVDEI